MTIYKVKYIKAKGGNCAVRPQSVFVCVCVFPKGKNGRKEGDRGSMWESNLCSRFIPQSQLPSEAARSLQPDCVAALSSEFPICTLRKVHVTSARQKARRHFEPF